MTDNIAEIHALQLPAAVYKAKYRHVETFLPFCKACGRYGKSWTCPPLLFDADRMLESYEHALLVCGTIEVEGNVAVDDALTVIAPSRAELETLLLAGERRSEGRAFGFGGSCSHCGEAPCARLSGKPCRHPELVRPSLEAFGFDLGATMDELFGLPLQWARGRNLPQRITLVSGIFHNSQLSATAILDGCDVILHGAGNSGL